jgi:GntR family transcriptional regulator
LNDGSIAPGSALPSEPDLVLHYRVSRTTVRRALARLDQEGRIIRRRGSGTFARQCHEQERLCLNLHAFYKDAPSIASRTSVSLLRFELDTVPAAMRALQPEVGSRALVIQRLRSFQGASYQLTTAYVPESIGRRIRKSSLGHASLVTVLDQIGPRTVTTEHTTSAVAADAIAARRLGISLGTPLLRIRAVLSDGNGRLRAVYESLSRPDRFHVRAELERDLTRSSQTWWRLKAR